MGHNRAACVKPLEAALVNVCRRARAHPGGGGGGCQEALDGRGTAARDMTRHQPWKQHWSTVLMISSCTPPPPGGGACVYGVATSL
jgi:hypothetical protein